MQVGFFVWSILRQRTTADLQCAGGQRAQRPLLLRVESRSCSMDLDYLLLHLDTDKLR